MVDQRSIPAAIEGGSLHALLNADSKTIGTDVAVQRRFPWLGFHFPHYQSDTPQSSILVGSLKLVHDYESDTDMLFDLADDLSEREDLAAKLPEKAAALRKDLERYLDEIDAQRPTANPRFDQSKSMETGKKREGRGQNKALKKVGKR